MQISVHWVGYGLLVVALGAILFVWRESSVNDQKIALLSAQAKTAQETTDAKAQNELRASQIDLSRKNQALQTSLSAAKSTAQKIALINSTDSTHLQLEAPGDNPPSIGQEPLVTVPVTDLATLAKQAVDLKEAQNQVAADQLALSAKQSQLEARNQVIADDKKEISTLKGGGHLKRFFTATKYVLEGAAVGGVLVYAADHR